MKDWHLVLAVFIMVGVIVVMATLGAAIPKLRPDLEKRVDKERPIGKDASSNYVILHCIIIF